MPLYFWGYVEYVDIFKNKRTQNRPFGSLPLIPQQRKYKGHRPWSGWGHWRPTQRTAAKSIPIQSRRQQGRAASEAQ
jgi:hypothetical protein